MSIKKAACYLFLILSQILISQENKEPLYYYGGYLDYNFNIHIADFKQLPGIPSCCPQYTDGSGGGFAIGGLFEIPFNPAIGISFRLGYSGLSGDLTKVEKNIGNTIIIPINDPNNPIITSVDVEHLIEAKLHTLGFEPTVNFKFFHNLYMDAGFRLGYLFSSKINHSEKIIRPENVTFLDGRVIRNDTSNAELPNRNSLQVFGIVGIGYQLPISKDAFIQPELRYHIPFLNISDVSWKVATLQLGASIKFPIYEQRIFIRDTVYIRDTTEKVIAGISEPRLKLINERKDSTFERTVNADITTITFYESYERQIPREETIAASIQVIGVSKDGTKQDVPTIVIEELETEEGFPLLPHVYFKEGSSDINLSGLHFLKKEETSAFSEDSLPWKTLDIYSELLNIVAYRLVQNKKASITITGCNKNLGPEVNKLDLSEKRTLAVKDYLVNIWGIKSDRIKLDKRNLPDKPGNNLVTDGQIENQRAELSSYSFEILKPVNLTKIARQSNPPLIEIIPTIAPEKDLKNWTLNINQQGKTLRSFDGQSKPGKLNWNVEEAPLPEIEAPVNIELKAYNKFGKEADAGKDIKIKQLTIREKRYELKDDKRIERYSLILFDYDKADITPRHEIVLQDIKKRIQPNSFVTISGYADRTGEVEYNRDLARRRNFEVQKVLQVKEANLKMNAIGSDYLLYNNDIPQGRGYSRTVQIVIETPIK